MKYKIVILLLLTFQSFFALGFETSLGSLKQVSTFDFSVVACDTSTPFFNQSPLAGKLQAARNDAALAADNGQNTKALMLSFELMRKISSTGRFTRTILGQIVNSGDSIRDGYRTVTYSDLTWVEFKKTFTVTENIIAVRSEWKNVNGQRGEILIKDRKTIRSTMHLFSIKDCLFTVQSFRVENGKPNRPTAKGFVKVSGLDIYSLRDVNITTASQSGISDYPVSTTESVKAISQSLRIIAFSNLVTDAATITLDGQIFGEWEQVTSNFEPYTPR